MPKLKVEGRSLSDIPSTQPLSVFLQMLFLLFLQNFHQQSSPGFSGLHVEHLLEVVAGTSVPTAQDCLDSLTKWVCLAL